MKVSEFVNGLKAQFMETKQNDQLIVLYDGKKGNTSFVFGQLMTATEYLCRGKGITFGELCIEIVNDLDNGVYTDNAEIEVSESKLCVVENNRIKREFDIIILSLSPWSAADILEKEDEGSS